MAAPLSPADKNRLRNLHSRYGKTGLPWGHPDRAWVEYVHRNWRSGVIELTPEESDMVRDLLQPTLAPEELEKQLPELILLSAPAWLRVLLRLPIVGPFVLLLLSVFGVITYRGMTRMVMGWFGVAMVSMYSALFSASPRLARWLGERVAKGAKDAPEVWGNIVARVVEDLTGREAPPGAFVPKVGPAGVAEAVRELAKFMFESFTGFLAPWKELTPERGREAAISYLSLNMSLQMRAWYLGLVHEMMSLGISRSLKDLPAQISWSMGLGWLSWLVFGVPFRAVITEPLETLYNLTYQFERLATSQIVSLRRSRWIDDEQYIRWMAERGFNYQKSSLLLEDAMAQPTLGELRKWWEQGIVDEEFVRIRLRRLGYRDMDAQLFLDSWRRERTKDELDKLVSAAEKLYQKGKISYAQLSQVWDLAGLLPDEQGLRDLRLGMEVQEERTLSKAEVLDAYRDEAIDAWEARTRLREMGYGDSDIDILLRREEKRISPAQVVDALVRGLISRSEAKERLQREGYPPEDADLLLSLRERVLTPGQILDALERGLISPRDARERLARLGYSEENIALLIAYQRKMLTPGDIQAALLRGLLTEEEAMTRLLQQGYDRSDAQILIQLRWRMLSVGQVIDADFAGFITTEEAIGRLMALGYTPDDAELLILTARKKRG